ncbi:MAG: molybdenum ABC transporter permease [Proteobacteria bacterium]|nr:molybdenum ABC transporter permease [Pseudomonadota bacterium]
MEIFAGVLLMLAGYLVGLYVRRRAFYRRNEAGVEEFDSFGKSIASGLFEGVLKILSVALIFFGVLAIFAGAVASM